MKLTTSVCRVRYESHRSFENADIFQPDYTLSYTETHIEETREAQRILMLTNIRPHRQFGKSWRRSVDSIRNSMGL